MSEFRNSAFYKPSSVKLEFVRGCNRKCEFCATNGITAEHAHMTMETLERAVTLIKESGYNPRIQIDGRGEHTLHPNFYAMVKKIKEIIPTSCIQLISNGWLVQHSEHAIPKMLKAGINDITLDEYFDSHFDPEYVQKEISLYTKKTGNKVDFFIMGPGVPMYGEKNPNKRRVVIVPDISAGQITVSRKLTNQCGAECVREYSVKYLSDMMVTWFSAVRTSEINLSSVTSTMWVPLMNCGEATDLKLHDVSCIMIIVRSSRAISAILCQSVQVCFPIIWVRKTWNFLLRKTTSWLIKRLKLVLSYVPASGKRRTVSLPQKT